MTEQELIKELEKTGYIQTEIKELLEVYAVLKKENPDFTLDECYNRAVKAYKETVDWPKDGVSVD